MCTAQNQHRAYLGLGSNVGDKEENLRLARAWLTSESLQISRASSLYKTSPVDYSEQDWFVNQVLETQTCLRPPELLALCLRVENKIGRERVVDKGPRTIDIDVLFYEDWVINEFDLVIPHPRLHERKFVLVPLAELQPEFLHPTLKKSIRELLAARDLDPAEVERL